MNPAQRIQERIADDEPITWSFLGDSVTAASWHTWGGRGFAELLHERLREMRRTLDLVINSGVSGWELTDNAQMLERICLQLKPDIVVITTGINDTRQRAEGIPAFKKLYLEVIERIHSEVGAEIVVQTPNGTLPTGPDHVVEHLEAYVEAVREVAAAADTMLVDQYAHWEVTDVASTFHWLGHGCHPNAYGHRAMARLLMQELGIWNDDSRTAKLLIP